MWIMTNWTIKDLRFLILRPIISEMHGRTKGRGLVTTVELVRPRSFKFHSLLLVSQRLHFLCQKNLFLLFCIESQVENKFGRGRCQSCSKLLPKYKSAQLGPTHEGQLSNSDTLRVLAMRLYSRDNSFCKPVVFSNQPPVSCSSTVNVQNVSISYPHLVDFLEKSVALDFRSKPSL